MLRWGLTDSGLRLSHASTTIRLTAPDWQPTNIAHRLPRGTNAVAAGTVSQLQVPATNVELRSSDGSPVPYATGVSLATGTHYLSLSTDGQLQRVLTDGSGTAQVSRAADTALGVTIAFDGPAQVRPLGSDLGISFDERTALTVGIPHEHTIPAAPITVTETPEGIATALSHLSAGHLTTGAQCSHPAWRHHPPLVELGDEIDVPDAIRERTPQTELEFKLPPSTEALYVAAPLAYYLGATVTVEDLDAPLLVTHEQGFEHSFSNLPAFQHEVASLLRRQFFADCLLRDVAHETPPRQTALLSEWGLCPDTLGAASVAERFAAMREIPETDIMPHLPEWYLATYVDPDPAHVRSLPFLLDNMSLIYLPEASAFDGKELIRRSLDDFYRVGPQAASVDVLMPTLQSGSLHGWLAAGTPIDVFKVTHSAYVNRLKYGRQTTQSLSVDVVLNDGEMDAEHEEVAAIYRERAADLPIDVTVHKSLKRKELAAVFEAKTDFVHYIGHCDVDGLRCPNGNLAIADIGEVNARTFFLNACGSYHEGISLVEKGSVSGAVTLTKVLNDQAATVGAAFARLLINGFEFERAMQLARRRIMMGKDYAVVGDGTYTLAASTDRTPAVAWVEKRGERFDLTYEANAAWRHGDTYPDPRDQSTTGLYGAKTAYDLSREELRSFLSTHAMPVIFDGDFSWSTNICEKM
ncbi:hypothetical protein ACFQH3_05760 [Haladaptatus sp. GCM10025707]|uniref:hypothetical protein n=2 Tax=Haladaptatus TaxID=367188 RepID=UPI0023E8AF8E|nr:MULTISPECIES: hypothetical protein [unclassified Haladaptatus]